MDNFLLIKNIHQVVVLLFLLIYLFKTIFLLSDKNEKLDSFTKKIKVPEMIISFLFLATGIYLIIQKGEVNTIMIFKLIAVFASIPLAVVGFKKKNKALATVSFLLIVMAYGFAEMSAKRAVKKEIEMPEGDVLNTDAGLKKFGQGIYLAQCASCHGVDGKKNLGGATDLSLSSIEEPAVKDVIKNGRNSMISFGGVLDEKEIESVTKYVMTLRN